MSQWTKIGTVASFTDPETLHAISRHVNGHLGCSCKSYQFAKGEKTCKHLDVWQAGLKQEATMVNGHAVTLVNMKVLGGTLAERYERYVAVTEKVGEPETPKPDKVAEVFKVVRRSISFGSLKP